LGSGHLRTAANHLTPGLESVFFNAEHNFTLQYPVILAPLEVDDPEDIILRKISVTATYLDIFISRRIWNFRAIDYSAMQYGMFIVMRDIRHKGLEPLVELLHQRLDADGETFESNDSFRLHAMNGRQIHRLLARMIDFLETRSGMPSHYTDYAKRGGKDAFEIEHIWANHPELHEDEFSHPSEFAEYRNRIGGLLLLPKSFNAAYGDLPYESKVGHYDSQNLLARSLNEHAYDRNPGFLRFLTQSGLPFHPHTAFLKTDLDSRQQLYQNLAALIWSPDRLSEVAGLSASC
jgi:Protein of unknown function (DUF1524)